MAGVFFKRFGDTLHGGREVGGNRHLHFSRFAHARKRQRKHARHDQASSQDHSQMQ
jgi:hypothetical protein